VAPVVLLALLGGCALGRGEGWTLERVFEVRGRQGIATDGSRYFVSGSKALFVYSRAGEELLANRDPFESLEKPANHIGDIDVHDGEIYAGVEWFVDGQGRDIQIAIYDAETLEYRRSIDWDPDSGQVEVSAVAVDADRNAVWMTDWVDGRYVYRYELDTGEYAGRMQLRPVPHHQQGVTVRAAHLLITADDGDADIDEPDSLWRVDAATGKPSGFVALEKTFDEFRRAGEVEGLCFDDANGELVVLSNRGSRIELGMPSGFYPGYDREIHEVYVFSATGGR
jgi:hypothetical protein